MDLFETGPFQKHQKHYNIMFKDDTPKIVTCVNQKLHKTSISHQELGNEVNVPVPELLS